MSMFRVSNRLMAPPLSYVPTIAGPGTWVGFRAAGAAGSDATGDIQACL